MPTKWNDTPITDIVPEGDMQILCVLKTSICYGRNHVHSNKKIKHLYYYPNNKENMCIYHDYILLSWDNYAQRWIDNKEITYDSDDVILWQELVPMSAKQLMKIQNKIAEQKGEK